MSLDSDAGQTCPNTTHKVLRQNSISTFVAFPCLCSIPTCCSSTSPSIGGKLYGLITSPFLLLNVNAKSSPNPLVSPPPPPFSWNTGSRWIFSMPWGGSSCNVDALGAAFVAITVDEKGASSITPSLRSSIQRVKPVLRAWRVRGRVIIAVRFEEYLRRRARRAWRNWRRRCGLEACGG